MKLTLTTSATLTASDGRTLKGTLLPYGEVGYPGSHGKLTCSRGSLLTPLDPSQVILNIEHDQAQPVGHALTISDSPDGISAEWSIAAGTAGDAALNAARAGHFVGFSIEVDNPVIQDQTLIAGIITGAALTAAPAYQSATLTASKGTQTMALTPEEIQQIADAIAAVLNTAAPTDTGQQTAAIAADQVAAVVEQIDPGVGDETQPVATAKIPVKASAPHLIASDKRKMMDAKTLFKTLAAAGGGDRRVMASLADVVPANILGIELPQFVGELWNGKRYQRRIIPAFNHEALDAFKIQGWRWVTRPTVAKYGGNKTEIPTGPLKTEQVELLAQRIAGGHDIDRKFRDFGNTSFWDAYFKAMTDSYAEVSDAEVLAEVLAAAPTVELGSPREGIAPGIQALIRGIMSILTTTNQVPDNAFLSPDIFEDMMYTRRDDSLAYIEMAMGFENGKLREFTFTPDAQMTPGTVLVSAKDAVTVHELGGEAPIRVEALDIAHGGIDDAVFGYYAVNVHDAHGLALITVP